MYFVNNIQLNLYFGNTVVNLMHLFPVMKQGYALRNSLTLLFRLYTNLNGIVSGGQIVVPDELMNISFNGTIPAYFHNQDRIIPTKDAIQQGIIDKPLNTVQVIQLSNPQFNPNRFHPSFLQNIELLNFTRIRDIDNLQNAHFGKAVDKRT